MRCLLILIIAAAGMLYSQYSDALLAVAGDKVITLSELQQMTRAEETKLAAAYSGAELRDKIAEVRRKGLDTLIERELFYIEFQALKAKIPAGMLQDRINFVIGNATGGNTVKFEEELQANGMTMAQFKEDLGKNLAVELLVRDRISRGNLVSDSQVKEYYSREKSAMVQPRCFRIAVIQLAKEGRYKGRTDQVFREIMDKLKEGTLFEELAKSYSDGANAEKGGDQGWMPGLHENILALVNDLAPGQVSDRMAEIGSSFYIVKVLDLNPGGIPELTAELAENIREKLVKEEEERRYKAFVRELYMKYPVKRMDGMK